MKFYFFIFINIILLILAVVVGSQNGHTTEFNYLVANSQITVAVLVGLSLLAGAIMASLFWLTYTLKLKFLLQSQKRKMVRSLSNND